MEPTGKIRKQEKKFPGAELGATEGFPIGLTCKIAIQLKFANAFGVSLKPTGKFAKPKISFQGRSQGPLTHGQLAKYKVSFTSKSPRKLKSGTLVGFDMKPTGKIQGAGLWTPEAPPLV